MTIIQAKEMDMVDYLSALGYKPTRVSGRSYWYLSPLHEEKTASFKINRQLNRWYDFAEGKGGNLVDFGVLYHRCNVSDLLQKLDMPGILLNPHQKPALSVNDVEKNRIEILSVHHISSYPLIRYLRSRRIADAIADQYCKEVRYRLGGKIYYALGFKNDEDGYELRNEFIKASSSPKAVTFINNGATDIAVFEGFFNFLSFRTLYDKQEAALGNYLVLNSASFFEKSLPKMQEHRSVHLYLDIDRTGQNCTQQALTLDPHKFHDERKLYQHYNDLNDWHRHMGQSQKHRLTLKT